MLKNALISLLVLLAPALGAGDLHHEPASSVMTEVEAAVAWDFGTDQYESVSLDRGSFEHALEEGPDTAVVHSTGLGSTVRNARVVGSGCPDAPASTSFTAECTTPLVHNGREWEALASECFYRPTDP